MEAADLRWDATTAGGSLSLCTTLPASSCVSFTKLYFICLLRCSCFCVFLSHFSKLFSPLNSLASHCLSFHQGVMTLWSCSCFFQKLLGFFFTLSLTGCPALLTFSPEFGRLMFSLAPVSSMVINLFLLS